MSKAYDQALKWLVRREHAQLELYHKLNAKEYPQDVIEQTLTKLKAQGYQSDERFSEMFIRSRLNQGKGRYLIEQQLKQKGIDDANFSGIDFAQQARSVYDKKYGDSPITSAQEKSKRMRFLQSRGFSFDDIKLLMK